MRVAPITHLPVRRLSSDLHRYGVGSACSRSSRVNRVVSFDDIPRIRPSVLHICVHPQGAETSRPFARVLRGLPRLRRDPRVVTYSSLSGG